MFRIVYVVADAQGSLVFTTKKGALDYVFKGESSIEIGEVFWRTTLKRSTASRDLKTSQISGTHPDLGDFTVTPAELITRGATVR